MILTCPACDTKYVVKDDAIPPGGRQVRCASCKHSWHQDPEGMVVEAESVAVDFGGPPEAVAEAAEQVLAEEPPQAVEEGLIAGEPQPDTPDQYRSDWTVASTEAVMEPSPADEVSMEEAPAVADEWRRAEPRAEELLAGVPAAVVDEPEAVAEQPTAPVEEEFSAMRRSPTTRRSRAAAGR